MTSELLASVLATAPVFDGHNDLPYALNEKFGYSVEAANLSATQPALHTDIPALRAGHVGAQYWSVFVPSDQPPADAVVATLAHIDCVHRLVDAHPDAFALATTAADVDAAVKAGKVASLMGMEGGHSIDSSLAVLRQMRRAGAGYMTLTHNDNTPWAASATGETVDYGLTDFGREVVAEMNRIGMLVDLSHVHERTMNDALDASTSPVIFSHSSCRAVVEHPRNVPDSVPARLAGDGGLLMVTFVPQFVSAAFRDHHAALTTERERLGLNNSYLIGPDEDPAALAEFDAWEAVNPAPTATIADVVAHLEHARTVAGIDHIGLGGDFDGVTVTAESLERVSGYPALLEALVERGWSADDIGKITYRNMMRVLAATDGSGA